MATAMPFDLIQPRYPGDSTAGFPQAPRKRPGRLTAVCVIAIVLGALGLCTSLVGLASLAFQDKLMKFANQQQLSPEMENSFLKKQNEMQKKINEVTQMVTHRHLRTNAAILGFNLMFAVSLLVGGVMTLRLNPTACKFLVVVFVAAIAFEIVRSFVVAFTQLDLFAELSAIKPVGSGPADLLLMMMKMSAIVGLVFWLVLALAKVIFYSIGAFYLRRPNISPLFEPIAIDQM